MVNCMRVHKAVQTSSKPDGLQHDRSAACVFAQQFSPSSFVSFRFHCRKKIIRGASVNFILLFKNSESRGVGTRINYVQASRAGYDDVSLGSFTTFRSNLMFSSSGASIQDSGKKAPRVFKTWGIKQRHGVISRTT